MYDIVVEGLSIFRFNTLKEARHWCEMATTNAKEWPIILGPETRLQQTRGPSPRPAWKPDP